MYINYNDVIDRPRPHTIAYRLNHMSRYHYAVKNTMTLCVLPELQQSQAKEILTFIK